ncbi:MAG TPA: DUF1648 domain-containing protein [Terriglobales bacterium]|nr:DUF1648 domain-containing protein [Terriglobales bacterium]
MGRTLYRLFSWLLWLGLPVVALRLFTVWDRLPMRLATHFDLAGRPNGWMSPNGFLAFTLVTVTAIAAISIMAAYRASQPDLSAWTLLGFFYVVVGILYGAADSIVNYNLYGRGVRVAPYLIAGFGSLFVLLVVYIGTRRGPQLPAESLVADEVHASRLWALVLALPVVLLAVLAAAASNVTVRLVLVLPIMLLVMAVIMAWSGFHYIFSDSGLEIRTLGFRLRTIPVSQIRNYTVDTWGAAGGYGIRGVGNTRAYVWGKKGVRIHLWDGEVFLGHREPERLVHDLDAVMSFAH